jgi:type IV pilus assembly protein PilB
MSELQPPATRLRPVPTELAGAQDVVTEPEAERIDDGTGITPPRRRGGGSRFLSDVIVDLGLLPRERVDAAVEEGRSTGRAPEQILLQSGALSSDQLARAIAERFGLDYVDLSVYKPDLATLNLVTPQAARRYDAAPIGFHAEGSLVVAMADPSNVLALDDMKLMTGHDIRPVVASPEDIAALITKLSRLDDAVAAAVEEEDEEDDLTPVTEIHESAEDAPVVKLVNSVILQAVEDGASDIHFEPAGRDMRVRYRVDGVLHESTVVPRRMISGVISRVKIMADIDIAERRLPQDGRVGLTVEGHSVDIRVATLPSVHGEGIVMRLLDKDQAFRPIEELGMRDAEGGRFERSFRQAFGAVLVTGPTGSGKTTTLYAALNAINDVAKNIITIEDPVEYQLEGVNQVQVNLKAGLTFSRGLRSMLRADPDVIMVGEIRDAETARIACEAALTGHLVLSTMHTNDAPSSVTRLTEMGIEPFLTASAVDCVVAQRLARTLCTSCKRETVLTVDALRSAGFEATSDLEAYEQVGCSRCGGSGYKGRIGLYEVMVISDEIRDMTIDRASSDAIRRVAIEQGMRELREDGLEKVRLGLTSITEVTRVT